MSQKSDDNYVIVVSGLPRSGTSMMMKMLDAGGMPILSDNLRTADEDNPKGYFEYEPVKELDKAQDKSWVENAVGRVVKVVSPLLQHLPDSYRYRVLFMRRNLREILLSQQKMLERRGVTDTSGDAAMFDSFMLHLSKVARFLESAPNFESCFFNHHDVLENPSEQARRINQFLKTSMDEAVMARVVDRALYRSKTPK